jgi:hypothetical protein
MSPEKKRAKRGKVSNGARYKVSEGARSAFAPSAGMGRPPDISTVQFAW